MLKAFTGMLLFSLSIDYWRSTKNNWNSKSLVSALTFYNRAGLSKIKKQFEMNICRGLYSWNGKIIINNLF